MAQKRRLYIGTGANDYVEFAAPGSRLSDMIATRASALNYSNMGYLLPNPDPVLKRTGKDIAVYRELLSDPRVGSNVENRRSGLLSQEWEIDRGKSKSRIAKFITDLFGDLPIQDIMSEMLEAPLFGYKPTEVNWQRTGRYLVPSAIEGKPPEWFGFDDENHLRFKTAGNIFGIDLSAPKYRYKFLLPRYQASYDNPYGTPLLARCFWYVTFKKGGLKFWVTYSEKFGMPYVMGRYRQGADDAERSELLDSLENLIQDAIAVIPEGDSIELLEHKGTSGSSDLFERLLRFCNEESTIAILGHPGSSQSTPGRLGSEDVAMDVRDEIVDADKRIVTSTLNQLIRWVVDLNFGATAQYPEFGIFEEEDVDQELATRDKNLMDAGVRLTRTYFQRAYGFADDEIDGMAAPASAQGEQGNNSAEFAEKNPPRPDTQQQLDEFEELLPADIMQDMSEELLAPVLNLIRTAESFEEVREKLPELYDLIDDRELIGRLESVILGAQVVGREEGQEEE